MFKFAVSEYILETAFLLKGGLNLAKEYELKVITKFNDSGSNLEKIILNILEKNIFSSAQIDFQENKIIK